MRKYKITEVITYEFEARGNEEAIKKVAHKHKYCKGSKITLEVYKGDELIKKASSNNDIWGFVK